MIRLLAMAGKHPCVMMGRTMKEYARFHDVLEMADRDLAGGVAQAYAFTRALPAKAPKAAAKAAVTRRRPA
jgi:hypothetical protein